MRRALPATLTVGLVALSISCQDGREPLAPAQRPASSRALSDVQDSIVPPEGPYQMIDLGNLGGPAATANDINDQDVIVGASHDSAGVSHAFLWKNGVMQDLGTLGGKSSSALRVNRRGDVAGISDASDGTLHVFLWQAGAMQDLGPVSQVETTVFLNDQGEVAWTSSQGHAQRWSRGITQDLGTLGGSSSQVSGINDQGAVTGKSSTGTQTDAYVWTPTAGMQDIVPPAGSGVFLVAGINRHGWVAGTFLDNRNVYNVLMKAFVWDGTQLTVIPVLSPDSTGFPHDSEGVAIAINDGGQVVENSLDLNFSRGHPALWDRGVLVAANAAHADYQNATAMNSQGVVTGYQELGSLSIPRAIVLDHGTSWDLGTIGDQFSSSKGNAINRAGDVAGFAGAHAILWQRLH